MERNFLSPAVSFCLLDIKHIPFVSHLIAFFVVQQLELI